MKRRFFDAHCHLQDMRIFKQAGRLIEEAGAVGVEKLAVNGCCEEDWSRVATLHSQHPNQVVPSFGLHPWFLRTRSPSWLDALRSALSRHPESGLGEAGLDKSRSVLDHSPMSIQMEIFTEQLRLARTLGRPVSVHCVKAWGPMQKCLKEEGPFPEGVVLHSFNGPAEVVRDLVSVNAFFSISLSILRIKLAKARAALEAIPLERLLLETDSPDAHYRCEPDSQWEGLIGGSIRSVEPEEDDSASVGCETLVCCCSDSDPQSALEPPRQGIRRALNHPANVSAVLKVVAELTGRGEDAIAAATFSNACKVFKLSEK